MANAIPITGLTAGTAVLATDVYPAVDTTDFTQAPTGTTKKYTIAQLQTFMGALTIVPVSGSTATIQGGNAYIINNAGPTILTLNTVQPLGSLIYIVGNGVGQWTVDQTSGQSIQIGNVSSTIGVGGSVSSNDVNDCLIMMCTTANTKFVMLAAVTKQFTIV